MGYIDCQLRELRSPFGAQGVPAAPSAPVINEGAHPAAIVPADDGVVDGTGDAPDFVEQCAIASTLEEMEAARLDKRERLQALRSGKCEPESHTATIGVSD